MIGAGCLDLSQQHAARVVSCGHRLACEFKGRVTIADGKGYSGRGQHQLRHHAARCVKVLTGMLSQCVQPLHRGLGMALSQQYLNGQ